MSDDFAKVFETRMWSQGLESVRAARKQVTKNLRLIDTADRTAGHAWQWYLRTLRYPHPGM